jgi:SHS2 domain-containing protein
MPAPAFEELEHTADWALRVRGAGLPDLLRNAALGMLQLCGAVAAAGPRRRRRLRLDSLDRESLLVDFLQELLLGLELRQVTYPEVEIEAASDTSLQATLVEAPLQTMAKPIKAVTYNELRIESDQEGLVATLVFDV